MEKPAIVDSYFQAAVTHTTGQYIIAICKHCKILSFHFENLGRYSALVLIVPNLSKIRLRPADNDCFFIPTPASSMSEQQSTFTPTSTCVFTLYRTAGQASTRCRAHDPQMWPI
jgi:hypothetical protein